MAWRGQRVSTEGKATCSTRQAWRAAPGCSAVTVMVPAAAMRPVGSTSVDRALGQIQDKMTYE